MDNQVDELLEKVISYRQTVPKVCDELVRQDTAALMHVLRNIKIDLNIKVPRIEEKTDSKLKKKIVDMVSPEADVRNIKLCLKENLLNNSEFFGHSTERNQIEGLIERTVKFGESNSALIIGPRSSGKTTLINEIIDKLQRRKSFEKDSILVRLNGLIHTDDKLSLKGITYQMQLENVVDGKVFGTFAENLSFLLACLRTGDKRSSKSVIFILEEFDLFCFHHNQTLLYNLFDVSQSAHAPVCVLGVTCRLDVIELLEKRVKSRFSHRQFFLLPDNTLASALDRIQNYLTVHRKSSKIPLSVQSKWNASVKALLSDKKVVNVIQRLIDIDVSERALKIVLFNIVCKMKEVNLSADLFQNQLSLFETDDVVLTLQDLTVLELCLLISMKHHYEIYEGQSMNFEMVFARYMKFVKTNSNLLSVPKSVVMKAWEHLEGLELISMVSGGQTRTQKEYRFFNLLVMPSQINEAVKKTQDLPTEVVQWAHSMYA